MSLRTKLVAALTLLAVVATACVGLLSYQATADRLRVEVDRSLDDTVEGLIATLDREAHDGFGRPGRGARDVFPDIGSAGRGYDLVSVQILDETGTPVVASGAVRLPVDDADRARATGGATSPGDDLRRDIVIGETPYRLLTESRTDGGGAVQVARSLAENQRLLDSLRNRMIVVVLLVAAAAAAIGWLFAWQITRRLTRLTAAAEHVADTGRLDVDVAISGADEAGRLGVAFTGMLAALASSKADQQRLIQDAGHELRTPLTSLRTNVSVLRRHPEMDPGEMGRLLEDLDGESRELTDLVNELVELATDRRDDEPVQVVGLGEMAERVAERARRRTGRVIGVVSDGSTVNGQPQAIERAVSNLIDNAIKFDDGGSTPIEVSIQAGRIEVSDRGPGIDSADLAHLFDRFYRATSARSRPGSGLGLSIVKDVAERHGGSVFAANRPGGGATIGLLLPVAG